MNFFEYTQNNEQYLENPTEENSQILDEALKKKFVIRNGKRVVKWVTTRKGKYRVQIDRKSGQPKEVFITNKERINRKKGQKKAAIKRKAKQKSISRLRKKAFKVRHAQGMEYNTKNFKKKLSKEDLKDIKLSHSLLHPNMMREQAELLCESPWPEILPGFVWDFFAEYDPCWLMQLVTLYKFHEMESVVKGRNEVETFTVSPGELDTITKNLMSDIVFKGFARTDFKNLSDVEKEQFLAVVPQELIKAIGITET